MRVSSGQVQWLASLQQGEVFDRRKYQILPVCLRRDLYSRSVHAHTPCLSVVNNLMGLGFLSRLRRLLPLAPPSVRLTQTSLISGATECDKLSGITTLGRERASPPRDRL
ncbi:uncharacterized [Tachysurus ichikawai]